MFCPNCGNERVSNDTNYCNRCGFLLTGTAELLATGGVIPQSQPVSKKGSSPRKKGLKQALFIFLLMFLVVPIVSIFTIAIRVEPFAPAICAVTLMMGSILRAAYALLFESNEPGGSTLEQRSAAMVQQVIAKHQMNQLPEQRIQPAADFVAPVRGDWRETNDLEPSSVTESTTRLLSNEEKN
ncbi:MAG TPA: zinc ribbon domain-containing protein [Pyrinomonadaceae bacterium]|nr:zinc ribbon domain-containing protein [Pyrinomonadaceae bacterium]